MVAILHILNYKVSKSETQSVKSCNPKNNFPVKCFGKQTLSFVNLCWTIIDLFFQANFSKLTRLNRPTLVYRYLYLALDFNKVRFVVFNHY